MEEAKLSFKTIIFLKELLNILDKTPLPALYNNMTFQYHKRSWDTYNVLSENGNAVYEYLSPDAIFIS